MIDEEEKEYWTEETVSWAEPVYPDEEIYGEESSSPVDEEESGSEFASSGSTSE